MPKAYYSTHSSKIGTIYVASTDEGICKVCIPGQTKRDFFGWVDRSLSGYELAESGSRNKNIVDELGRYFDQRLVKFHTPLHMIGTDFQKKVWNELKRIRYGTTISYKELAKRVGVPGAYQTVGRVNAANPLPIIIPCHRVLGVDSHLTGYAGGVKTKEFLLRLEGALLL